MIEPHKATFIGERTIWNGVVKMNDSGDVFALRKKILGDEWVKVLGNFSADLNCYQERDIYDPFEKKDVERAKVYFIDLLTFKPYKAAMAPEQMRHVESLTIERDYLYSLCNFTMDLLSRAGMMDLVKEKMKSEYDFYHKDIKPGYVLPLNPQKPKKKMGGQ